MTDSPPPKPVSNDNVIDPADPLGQANTANTANTDAAGAADDAYELAQDVEYIDPGTDTDTATDTDESNNNDATEQAHPEPAPGTTTTATPTASPAYTPLHAAIEIDNISHRYAKAKRKRGNRKSKTPPPEPPAQPESEPDSDPEKQTQTPDPLLALNALSLRVDPGEIFGILGPNGSGKTTLIRIIATLLKPTAGRLNIFGNDALDAPQSVRAKLGVVFQTPSLDLRLTARENLKHHGELYGLHLSRKKRKLRIDALLDAVGLLDRAKEPVAQFSGGMRRRVEIAKALLPGPTLLVMDEPATGLDPTARTELQTILEDLRARFAVTVVLSTHLMDAAERCDRVAILDRGNLVAVDRPDALINELTGQSPTDTPNARVQIADIVTQDRIQQDILIARLDALFPHARVTHLAGTVRCENIDPVALTTALTEWHDLDIRRLTLGRPTLADVFTNLTGRPLN